MATYDQWNSELIAYFTGTAPRGSPVFLSVDDELLREVGRNLLGVGEDPVVDFLRAVQDRTVTNGRVNLQRVRGRNDKSEPRAVAFLAAMVLAAARMADDEEISQLDYFNRVREVLGLPNDGGRPRGMEFGAEAEEPLWREWVIWLQENGYLAAAQPGEGPKKYTNYPISQALLREVDRERLRQLFTEKHWPRDWDVSTLLARVRHEADHLSRHLRDLLSSGGKRAEGVAEAIYEVYESWQDDGEGLNLGSSPSPRLLSGLYRVEDAFSGDIEYYLYPRKPRRATAGHMVVRLPDETVTLADDRPGWYAPIHCVREGELDNGVRYPIEQQPALDALVLPERQFWVLSSDPDSPDSGVYASWGTPPLGVPFILLCRAELVPQLEAIRRERLIEWSGEPECLFSDGRWVEFRHCLVVSQGWSDLTIENRDLYEALKPNRGLNVSVSGGLRVSTYHAWIEGHGPQVTVYGFHAEVDLRIIRVADEAVVLDQAQKTNLPLHYDWPTPSDYRIEATCAGEMAERLVKIVEWDALRLVAPDRTEAVELERCRITGAWLETVK